jgi:hypothetical protein
MKIWLKVVLSIIILVIVSGTCLIWYALSSTGAAKDLGLTRIDMAIGEIEDAELIRTNTKVVADTYLAQHNEDFVRIFGSPYRLSVNYGLTPKVRSLGYRSSFYYFCWDIYLPYSLRTDSGEDFLVLVQLSDRMPGNKHDISNFRVIRAYVIDNANQVKAQINE